MRRALILTLLGCALAGVALAQQPPTTQRATPAPCRRGASAAHAWHNGVGGAAPRSF